MKKERIEGIGAEKRKELIDGSAYALPNNPSAHGMTAEAIKRSFITPITGAGEAEYATKTTVVGEINRIVDELNAAIDAVEAQASDDTALVAASVVEASVRLDNLNERVSELDLKTDAVDESVLAAKQASDDARSFALVAEQASNDVSESAERIKNVIEGAPESLDTLKELAAALNNDENLATNLINAIAEKIAKTGDTMTGPLKILRASGEGNALHIRGDAWQIELSPVKNQLRSMGIGTLWTEQTGKHYGAITFRDADSNSDFVDDGSLKETMLLLKEDGLYQRLNGVDTQLATKKDTFYDPRIEHDDRYGMNDFHILSDLNYGTGWDDTAFGINVNADDGKIYHVHENNLYEIYSELNPPSGSGGIKLYKHLYRLRIRGVKDPHEDATCDLDTDYPLVVITTQKLPYPDVIDILDRENPDVISTNIVGGAVFSGWGYGYGIITSYYASVYDCVCILNMRYDTIDEAVQVDLTSLAHSLDIEAVWEI